MKLRKKHCMIGLVFPSVFFVFVSLFSTCTSTDTPTPVKMYWSDYGLGAILHANLDGSDVEDVVTTGISNPSGIAEGKLYWSDDAAGMLQRANLDGSYREDNLISGFVLPVDIAIAPNGGKVYWVEACGLARTAMDIIKMKGFKRI